MVLPCAASLPACTCMKGCSKGTQDPCNKRKVRFILGRTVQSVNHASLLRVLSRVVGRVGMDSGSNEPSPLQRTRWRWHGSHSAAPQSSVHTHAPALTTLTAIGVGGCSLDSDHALTLCESPIFMCVTLPVPWSAAWCRSGRDSAFP